MTDPTVFPPPPPNYTLPVEPPRRSYKGWIIGGSVAGGILLIGGVVAIGFIVATAIEKLPLFSESGFTDDAGGDQPGFWPLMTGDEASGTATNPMQCAGPCFSAADASSLVVPKLELKGLGLSNLYSSFEDSEPSTVASDYTYAAQNWSSSESSPDECFFTSTSSPIVVPYDSRPAPSTDVIRELGSYSDDDEYNTLDHVLRVFPSTEAAQAHMASLKEQIDGCTHYESGTGASFWAAAVSPAPALEVPESVAELGWREDGNYGRYYVFDVQRGNLVVRLTAYSSGDLQEKHVRDMAVREAERLARLTPRN